MSEQKNEVARPEAGPTHLTLPASTAVSQMRDILTQYQRLVSHLLEGGHVRPAVWRDAFERGKRALKLLDVATPSQCDDCPYMLPSKIARCPLCPRATP
jgi:hypothetical protein